MFALANGDRISPTTQLILLAILQGVALEDEYLIELAERFHVSVMSISRTLDELEGSQLVKARHIGRQRRLHMTWAATNSGKRFRNDCSLLCARFE